MQSYLLLGTEDYFTDNINNRKPFLTLSNNLGCGRIYCVPLAMCDLLTLKTISGEWLVRAGGWVIRVLTTRDQKLVFALTCPINELQR